MSILREIFDTLREYYSDKAAYLWWPEDPVEVILGAVLVQGSTWKSADKVLNEFRSRKLLDFKKIAKQTEDQLSVLIRPVGFQTKKSVRIKAVAQLILDRSGGNLDRFFAREYNLIRRELLSISGIGPGTADNILLYAGQTPIYMVDTFTVRILIRHGIADIRADEKQIQELIHKELTHDEEPFGAKLYQQMQEYLVRLGRDFCDKSRPDCAACPLNIYLPDEGAVGIPSATSPAKPASVHYPKKTAAPIQTAAKPSEPKTTDTTNLNDTERRIVETMGEEPVPIDTVVFSTGLPVHIVRATIAVLQMKKIVVQVEGNQVRLR